MKDEIEGKTKERQIMRYILVILEEFNKTFQSAFKKVTLPLHVAQA